MGNGWNRISLFILGLFCFLSGEEGQLALCRGFREITAIRLFVVGDGTILGLLFGLLLGFLPCCVAHVASVALMAVRLNFTELVVGGLAWRPGRGPMIRMYGIRGCAEVYGVFGALVNGLTLRAQLILSGQVRVNQGRVGGVVG